MPLFIWPHAAGTATPATPSATPDVPTIHARVAWRDEGFTQLAWDGSSTDGWVTGGTAISGDVSSLITTSSDSFGNDGTSSLIMVTQGTAASGVDFAIPGTAVEGRQHTFRVGLRSITGSTSTVLRAGNASDFATSTATISSTWAWQTVTWTPGTAITDGYVSIQNGEASAQTTGIDHAEFYETTDEVTLDALAVSRGSQFDGSRERPGRITMSILDPDADLSPRNTASDLYGLVEAGRRIHVRGVRNGRLYALAYGVIESVTPDPDTRTVKVVCTDGLGELDDVEVTRPFSFDKAAYTCRAEALADALATDQHDLATDSTEADTVVDGTDASTSLLSYLDDINEATGSVHWCRPHVEAIRPWRYTTKTRCELTRNTTDFIINDDFQTLTGVDIRDEAYLNKQRVSWVGYERRPSQVVVEATASRPYWTFTDEEYGSSETPEPEYIYRLTRRRKTGNKKRDKWKRRRKRSLKRIGKRWVDAVVPISLGAGETKTVSVDFKCPMQDLAATITDGGNVTATLTKEPAKLTISLTASSADTVTAISVTARPHLPLDEQEETADNSAAHTYEGRPIDNEFVGSAGMAEGLAEYLTWRYGDARLRPSVRDQHQMNRQLNLDIGSHVTLTASRWYISADRYVVRSIEHDVSGGGFDWQTTYGLEELPSGGDWLTLDGDASQGLDGSATLAY